MTRLTLALLSILAGIALILVSLRRRPRQHVTLETLI